MEKKEVTLEQVRDVVNLLNWQNQFNAGLCVLALMKERDALREKVIRLRSYVDALRERTGIE